MAPCRRLLSAGSLAILSLLSPTTALPSAKRHGYQLVDMWEGANFFSGFDFFVGEDPTKGFVTYLDQAAAEGAGLARLTDGGNVYMGVDDQTVLSPSGPGRKSVRIESKKAYEKGLFILDLKHMPGNACGSWPAFWTYGPNWPSDGEIDIIEAVNLMTNSQIVLHTSGTCPIAPNPMLGTLVSTDCGDSSHNQGCVVDGGAGTFGSPMNSAGGGVYAMEWTADHIAIWFFPHGAIPESVLSDHPDVASFGTPRAFFQGACNFAERFRQQKMVFDITFCGDWAGGKFGQSGCPVSDHSDPKGSCDAFVAANPNLYSESYWEVISLKVYQGAGATSPLSSPIVPISELATATSSMPVASSSFVAASASASALVLSASHSKRHSKMLNAAGPQAAVASPTETRAGCANGKATTTVNAAGAVATIYGGRGEIAQGSMSESCSNEKPILPAMTTEGANVEEESGSGAPSSGGAGSSGNGAPPSGSGSGAPPPAESGGAPSSGPGGAPPSGGGSGNQSGAPPAGSGSGGAAPPPQGPGSGSSSSVVPGSSIPGAPVASSSAAGGAGAGAPPAAGASSTPAAGASSATPATSASRSTPMFSPPAVPHPSSSTPLRPPAFSVPPAAAPAPAPAPGPPASSSPVTPTGPPASASGVPAASTPVSTAPPMFTGAGGKLNPYLSGVVGVAAVVAALG